MVHTTETGRSCAHNPYFLSMRINGSRLLQNLEALGRIGGLPGGGVTRLAFSAEDRAGRDFVAERIRALGLTPRVDAIGNLWTVRSGVRSDLPPVMLGSHTDSVAEGGVLDGALGVLAALEVLTVLSESGVETAHPVGLISFVNEEGVRFMPDMLGSLYLTGSLEAGAILGISGTDGRSIGEELARLDMAGSQELRNQPIHAFLELHIEQGPVLEREQLPIGVVTGVQGLRWLEVTLRGKANHAGTTPMAGRRDPGVAAGTLVLAARRLTEDVDGLRATVGRMVFHPNLVNVIPHEVVLTIDLRHPDQVQLDAASEWIRRRVFDAAAQFEVEARVRETASAPAVAFDGTVVEAVTQAVQDLGIPARRLISGAGHDAQIMAAHCASGMVFIRSRDGISHNPLEFSDPEDIVAGANALLGAALLLARGG